MTLVRLRTTPHSFWKALGRELPMAMGVNGFLALFTIITLNLDGKLAPAEMVLVSVSFAGIALTLAIKPVLDDADKLTS